MITASIAIYGMAALTGSAFALLSAVARADGSVAPTDRHEIPTFVLERVELATGADRWAPTATRQVAFLSSASAAAPEVFSDGY